MEEDHRCRHGFRRRRLPELAGLVRPPTLRPPSLLVGRAVGWRRRAWLTRVCSPCVRREHEHMHKPPEYPYLRIRNKPLPWGDGTKDLLDVRHEYVDDHH